MERTRINIEEADFGTLKAFAELTLGIEVRHGVRAMDLRGKIKQAMPSIETIPALPPPLAVAEAPAPAPASPVHPVEGEASVAISRPPSPSLENYKNDPRVQVKVYKTSDKARHKDVTMQVNGDVFQIQRGVWVDIPYRVYLALSDAREMQPIETDEINPLTGQPVMGWEEIFSYPHEAKNIPSEEEHRAWIAATSVGFKAAA